MIQLLQYVFEMVVVRKSFIPQISSNCWLSPMLQHIWGEDLLFQFRYIKQTTFSSKNWVQLNVKIQILQITERFKPTTFKMICLHHKNADSANDSTCHCSVPQSIDSQPGCRGTLGCRKLVPEVPAIVTISWSLYLLKQFVVPPNIYLIKQEFLKPKKVGKHCLREWKMAWT